MRCVFCSDSGQLTFDVPPSETSAWRAIARYLRSPLDALSCALFPALCLLCDTPLARLSSAPVCDACWAELPTLASAPFRSALHCPRCGDALETPAALYSSLCRVCRLAPPPFIRFVAYGLYEDRLKAAIHALKFDHILSLSKPLGQRMAKAIATLADESPSELLVVPIPLHRAKRRQRGFNQARALAVHALHSLAESHPQWSLTLADSSLIRHRNTGPQAGLEPRARRMNVRGAFVVFDPAAVALKHILLVDDILTTGATARAAAKALLDAGAASVRVATLARALLYTRKNLNIRNLKRKENDEDIPRWNDEGRTLEPSIQQASMYSQHEPTH